MHKRLNGRPNEKPGAMAPAPARMGRVAWTRKPGVGLKTPTERSPEYATV